MDALALDVRLHVGQGTSCDSLTVFPVWSDAPSCRTPYVTGARALLDVSEPADTSTLDEVHLTNRSDRPALVLRGELLDGRWRHRALTGSAMLAPARPTLLTVVCVRSDPLNGDPLPRRRRLRTPLASLPVLEGPDQEQSWRRALHGHRLAGADTEPAVGSRDTATPTTRRLLGQLRPLAGQRGVLIGVAGRPVSLELFDSRVALCAHWAGVLRGAALQALGRPVVRTPSALARSFIERVQQTRLVPDGTAGIAHRLRSDGRIRVDGIRWPHRTVHLSALDVTHPQLAVPEPRVPEP